MNFPNFLSRSSGLKKRGFIGPYACLLAGVLTASGCSMPVSDPSGETKPLSAFAWSAPTIGIDTASGFAVSPQIAVEPDPGNNGGADDAASGGIAVWIEMNDIDPSDLNPATYHLYAKRMVGGTWDITDFACPFGFPYDISNDGVCLIDNGSLDFHAIGPRVSMDSIGNAIVVWQEYNSAAGRSRVYSRRYVMGTGWEAGTTALDVPTMGNAVAPDIAMEPDGGGTAVAVWSQFFPQPVLPNWSVNLDGGQENILSLGRLGSNLYAGQGSDPGDGDVLRWNGSAWVVSFNGAAEEIPAMESFNNRFYAAQGNTTGNGDIWALNGGLWTLSLDGAQEAFLSFAELNGLFYAGQGTDLGDGDIYVCNPRRVENENNVDILDDFTCLDNLGGNDWILSYDGTVERVESLAAFNGRLYAGLGTRTSGSGAGDILVCDPSATGNALECEAGDWSLAYDGAEEAILSLKVFNGLLYAGQGSDAGDGDVLFCDPTLGGDLTLCEGGEWSLSYDGAGSGINALDALKGFLFAAQGGGAGDGDVFRCAMGSDDRCDPADWGLSFDGAEEAVNDLQTHLEVIYAGQGTDVTDGDIYQFKVAIGWRGMARRFSGGAWAMTDALTGCSAGGINPDDGACDFDGSYTPVSEPLVEMDNSGNATVAYHRFDPLSCDQSASGDTGSGGGFNGGSLGRDNPSGVIDITCKASRTYANRFEAGLWGITRNLTPVQNIFDGGGVPGAGPPPPINENCEDMGNATGAKSETLPGSSACLWVSEISLAMDGAGNAYVAFKTYERAALTNAEVINNQPPVDLLDVHERKAVFVRKFTVGPGWDATPVTGITDYEYSPRVNGNTIISDCPSVNLSDTEDFVGVMNCDFRSLSLASKQDDGSRAMVAYERFVGPVGLNSSRYDIVVHRYNGAGFGSVPDGDNCTNAVGTCWHNVDNGTGESRVPSLAMDNNGNAVLLWVEEDASGRWRVYSNYCAENAGDCIWSGPVPVDSGIGGEYYFEPHAAMEALNAGNASALDCGGTGGANCGDAFSVYNVLTGIFTFRIDAVKWSPP